MNKLRGLMALAASFLFCASAQAGNPFQPFVGSGKASGTIWLVGKPDAESTKCSRSARTLGDDRLSFTLSCSGGKSFGLSCSFRTKGTRVSGSCSASLASLSGGGSLRGKMIFLSMTSNLGSHLKMVITPSSLSLKSPDAKYVKSLRISGL